MGISTYLSIITLNVNGLNAQIKDIGIGFKKDPSICCLQETHFRAKDTDWKWGDGKKIFHAKGNEKKAGVAITHQTK